RAELSQERAGDRGPARARWRRRGHHRAAPARQVRGPATRPELRAQEELEREGRGRIRGRWFFARVGSLVRRADHPQLVRARGLALERDGGAASAEQVRRVSQRDGERQTTRPEGGARARVLREAVRGYGHL